VTVTEIPGFELSGELGRGGSATVYGAYQSRFDRDVAIKVFNTVLGPTQLAQFEREMKAHGRLSADPQFVTVYSDGLLADGRPYLVMDRLTGGSLDTILARSGTLPASRVVEILGVLSRAMQVAHDAGIIHGDLKPSNVLLDGEARPVITDFGIARVLGTTASTIGPAGLTAAYAPREVVEGQRPERAADVYGLAAIGYALLAGRPPLLPKQDEPTSAFFMRLLDEGPEPLVADAPRAVIEIIEQVLHSAAEDRPTAAQFGEWLANATPGQIEAATEPAPGPVGELTEAAMPLLRRRVEPSPDGRNDAAAPSRSNAAGQPGSNAPAEAGSPRSPTRRTSTKVLIVVSALVAAVGLVAGAYALVDALNGDRSSGSGVNDDAAIQQLTALSQSLVASRQVDDVVTPVAAVTGFGSLWVISPAADQVIRLDAVTGDRQNVIAVPAGPIAIASDEKNIWVASAIAAIVTAIDPTTGDQRRIDVADDPTAIAAGAGGVWVAHASIESGSFIDPSTGHVTRLLLGPQPAAVTTSPNAAWFTTLQGGHLIGFRGTDRRSIGQLPLGGGTEWVAVAGDRVWATLRGTSRLRSAELLPLQTALDDPEAVPDLREGPTVPLPETPGPIAAFDGGLWVAEQFVGSDSSVDRLCAIDRSPRLWAIEPGSGQVVDTLDLGAVAGITCVSSMHAGPEALWITDPESDRVVGLTPG